MGLITSILVPLFTILVFVSILILAAEKTVDKLIALADHYNISNTFIGMTLVAMSTSLPEIGSHLVSSIGILQGTLSYNIASATVLGGNIGSDVVQQTLIIGVVVLLMGGIKFKEEFLFKDFLPMIGTTLLTLLLAFDGIISRLDGLILFSAFIAYVYFLIRDEENRKTHSDTSRVHPLPHVRGKAKKIERKHLGNNSDKKGSNNPRKDMIIACISMGIVLGSAHIVLLSTETLVTITGIGGSMIGVVILGIASALPELSTALSGLKKNAKGISLGTLIGSNITNPLVAIGMGGMLSTYWAPPSLYLYDLPLETITAALLLIYLVTHDRKLGKGGAIYLIGLYIAYIVVRAIFFAAD